jgi:integrase-like protein
MVCPAHISLSDDGRVVAVVHIERSLIRPLRWSGQEHRSVDNTDISTATPQLKKGGSKDILRIVSVAGQTQGVPMDSGTMRIEQQPERIAVARRDSAPGRLFFLSVLRVWEDSQGRAVELVLNGPPLPPVRLHDLRHGAASLTYQATKDLKLVSELLGHSGIQITADTYTTLFAEVDAAAAEAVAVMVPPHPLKERGQHASDGQAEPAVRTRGHSEHKFGHFNPELGL